MSGWRIGYALEAREPYLVAKQFGKKKKESLDRHLQKPAIEL